MKQLMEAGPLSQWLFGALAEAELPVVCVETRQRLPGGVKIDVSVKVTSICIVDDTGKIVREVKVASEPEATDKLRAIRSTRPDQLVKCEGPKSLRACLPLLDYPPLQGSRFSSESFSCD